MSENSRPILNSGADASLTERVRAFARSARVPVRSGRRCIDGRYPPGTADSGRLARPGGDFGYLLAVLAANHVLGLGWSAESCAERVTRAVMALGGGFSGHTDSLARGPEAAAGDLAGCGHLSAALQHAAAYGLEAGEIEEASQHALGLAHREGGLRIAVLEGQHAEQAVLLARGRAFSLESWLPGHGQYFIYDLDRDQDFLGKLAARLGFSEQDARELERIAGQQLEASVSYLAGNLPVFSVSVDEDPPVVSEIP